jgi:hypothetical protein
MFKMLQPYRGIIEWKILSRSPFKNTERFSLYVLRNFILFRKLSMFFFQLFMRFILFNFFEYMFKDVTWHSGVSSTPKFNNSITLIDSLYSFFLLNVVYVFLYFIFFKRLSIFFHRLWN